MLEILLYKYLLINTIEKLVTVYLWHEHGHWMLRTCVRISDWYTSSNVYAKTFSVSSANRLNGFYSKEINASLKNMQSNV